MGQRSTLFQVERLKNRTIFDLLEANERFVPPGPGRREMRNAILEGVNKFAEDAVNAFTGKLVRAGKPATSREARRGN